MGSQNRLKSSCASVVPMSTEEDSDTEIDTRLDDFLWTLHPYWRDWSRHLAKTNCLLHIYIIFNVSKISATVRPLLFYSAAGFYGVSFMYFVMGVYEVDFLKIWMTEWKHSFAVNTACIEFLHGWTSS